MTVKRKRHPRPYFPRLIWKGRMYEAQPSIPGLTYGNKSYILHPTKGYRCYLIRSND